MGPGDLARPAPHRADMRPRLLLLAGLFALATGCDLADPAAPGNLVPRTVAEDPALPAVDLAGTRLHLETFGTPGRRAIIFLHGGPGADYRGLLRLRGRDGEPRLEDDYFLVFWDQRGTGLSQRHDAADIDVDRYLDDLDAVIDRYAGGRPPILVGHSWGGMYATAYLDRHPDRVAAAVLLEPGPLTGALYQELADRAPPLDVTSEWLSDVLWSQRFLGGDDHARLDYAPLVAGDHAEPGYHLDPDDPMPLWRLGVVAQHALFASVTPDGVPSWDFVAHARAFTGPVTLVASERNEVIGVDFQARQAAFFTDPTLTVVGGAGHDFPWTRPDETVAAIRATAMEVGP
jgi:proline iminopeptidase